MSSANHARPTSPRPRNAVASDLPGMSTFSGNASDRDSHSLNASSRQHRSHNTGAGDSGLSDPGLAGRQGSSLEADKAHSHAFARSYTMGDQAGPSRSYGATSQNAGTRRRQPWQSAQPQQPRAASFHPGAPDAADQLQTFRDQVNGDGSDVEGRRASAGGHNSSDVVLQGRSYRFQQNPDYHNAMASPYTATSSSLRDSTALLAGMLLRSDDRDERSGPVATANRIDEQPEDEEAQASSIARAPVQITGFNQSPDSDAPHHHASASSSVSDNGQGLSNLSRAMLRTASNSPASTIKQPGDEAAKDRPLPSVIIDDERQDEARVDEATPLLSAQERGRRRTSKAEVVSTGSSDRTESASRSKSPGARQSSFSNLSGAVSDSNGRRSSVYGHGALARASQTRGGHHVSFAERETDDDEEEQTLAPAWAVVPRGMRPGRGELTVRQSAISRNTSQLVTSARKLTWRDVGRGAMEPIHLLPATFLGVLLNALDGVSYGLIIFPTSYGVFENFGGDGVSMFFVTCIISQLTFSLGGSVFKGGNGSMLIEVVPFYHILVTNIIDYVGEDQREVIISTTMVTYALSSLFAGIVFLLLGKFKLGKLIGFFPRIVLVGCIGGVGVFLFETGLEVTAQLKSEAGFQWDLDTFNYFTQSWLMVAHWLPPLGVAILLRIITARFHHPLIFPGYFVLLPIVFYSITGGLGVSLSELQRTDWVFNVGSAANAPFWRFYTYFDFGKVSWPAIWTTMKTQLALTFFSILHVPLNVPALAVSVNEDNLDTDRELFAHGISNIAAGLAGTVPNYLCYVNSVLFYRVGGGSRLSGLMLAAGTGALMLAGPGAIGYIPIIVVGALIFVLAIDLIKEAVWDTLGRVNRYEYATILLIMFVMTIYDFVTGILAGVLVACLFFVIQTSRQQTVRAVLDGSIARSTVRRHTSQRNFLSRVGKQTHIVKLQGFLYFATISSVEDLIRGALDIAQWERNPIRFLIVDFSLVSGLDFSAAEAFVRVQRILDVKNVVLIFCGLTPDSDVGIALRSVDLWTGPDIRLEVFQNLNEALEWTENEYLRSVYLSGLASAKPLRRGHQGALDVPSMKRAPAIDIADGFVNSPRQRNLVTAAQEVSNAATGFDALAGHSDGDTSHDESFVRGNGNEITVREQRRVSSASLGVPHGSGQYARPYSLIVLTFQAYSTERHNENFFATLSPYFQQIRLLSGETLWERGDDSDGIYVIESGILRARYGFQEGFEINESMLAGTIAGELTFLSHAPRNTTAFADLDCTLWKIDRAAMTALRTASPEVHEGFTQLLTSAGSDEQEGVMSYLVCRLS